MLGPVNFKFNWLVAGQLLSSVTVIYSANQIVWMYSGADPGFQARGGGGAHLKKLRRAEEGANILGVFRVKNHYFTPKNHSFYNYGGRREKFWSISCEKSRFYAKKTYFFPILGGVRAGYAPPPLDPPLVLSSKSCLTSAVHCLYSNVTCTTIQTDISLSFLNIMLTKICIKS